MEVVGAYDLRVAAGIALADGAALEHGDVLHAVLFREEICRREAVSAAADDDGVVRFLQRGAMQNARPGPPAVDRVPGEGEE